MSLVDAKYIEKAPHGRHGAHYMEKHDPNGRAYMWMRMTYSDVEAPRCTECLFSPFFYDANVMRCPKCGGRLDFGR